MEEIGRHLPGHNCGGCGYKRCDQFAAALQARQAELSACAVLQQERYRQNWQRLEKSLTGGPRQPEADTKPVGLIDGYEADFVLAPLCGEPSCREILLPLTPPALSEGEVIRYRPLGCPITHFARIMSKREGLLVVHIVGPRHRLGDPEFRFTEIGLCMVIGFEGRVEGRLPSVGETVRFTPAECMMQKVHSAVVVKCEGRDVLLEGLDLKVWAPPVRA
ncbi:MAG: (Fe-S)-binding protein [Spirochaetia bacterium]|jgi:uncharacterized Fe-S cluster-containing protein